MSTFCDAGSYSFSRSTEIVYPPAGNPRNANPPFSFVFTNLSPAVIDEILTRTRVSTGRPDGPKIVPTIVFDPPIFVLLAVSGIEKV